MKFVYILLLFSMLFVGQAFAIDHLVISEVLFDASGTETGGEAVEIYNPSLSAINLEGYYLKTESSDVDVTLPNFNLASGQFFLVADFGWSEKRDNLSYVLADHEEAITMYNSDSGVALVYNESIIDSVGWGNFTNIEEGLYEGNPFIFVSPGKSLQRINLDSEVGDNLLDFMDGDPDLKNSSYEETQEEISENNLLLNLSVGNSIPKIVDVFVDDDLNEEGIQIIPNVNSKRKINFQVLINDSDGEEDFDRMEVKFNEEDYLFNSSKGGVYLESYEEAKSYFLEVFVYDKSNSSANVSFEIEYQEMVALILDSSSLNLDGENPFVEGDLDMNTLDKPSIKNGGNVVLDIGVLGTSLESLPIQSMMFSTNNISNVVDSNLNIVNLGLEINSISDFGLEMVLNKEAQKGDYYGEISVIGIAS